MKQKTDVPQGTLALMVLKTLDVLGPLHGYGIARRIEQISGDLLTVNQGTLYPVLLKLEQEGSIASEWGASENNRRARFYTLTRAGRKQLLAETRGWEQTATIMGAVLCIESGGSAMKALRRFIVRLTSWTRRQRDEQRLQAEIEEHLAFQTQENIRAGLEPAEARRQAVLKFRAVEAMRESYRDHRGFPSLETLIQDTRYVLRRLRNAPAFTAATVLTLALGIGATTSIFTLVYAVLLKSLAVANPGELLRLGKESRCCYWGGYSQDKEFSLVSYELYERFRDNTKDFAQLAAFSATEPLFGIRRAGRTEPAQSYPGEYVSGNYFIMFGIQGYTGRMFTPSDDQPGAPPVAVMSYRLWQQRFGSDPSVIGSIFDIDQKPFTVIGIAPPGFYGDTLRDTPPDFFLPLNTEPLLEGDTDLNTPQQQLAGLDRPHPARRQSCIDRG